MATETLNTIKAALVPVIIKRGDETAFTIPLFDPNDDNNPVDLRVYASFRAQVKVDSKRDANVMELLSADSEIILGGAGYNELTFVISPAKSTIKAMEYTWDVEGIGGPQDPKTIVEGSFEVSSDVTR